MKLKHTNIIPKGLLALSLLSSPTYSDGSIELSVNNKGTLLDAKHSVEVTPELKLFTRGKTSVDYDGNTSHFGLADLSVSIVDGLSAVGEVQFIPDSKVILRVGGGYFKDINGLKVYNQTTLGKSDDKINIENFTNMSYNREFKDDLSLKLGLENTTNFQKGNHNYSMQSLKAGLGFKKYETGICVKLNESQGELNNAVGGYIKLNF